ncbi:HEPN domain-containing protein [Meiothermus rufus]|uniref:HEPN domain-containing protein n=1 Tax=Meiothermus rufus TaxID=604332 RepID=UPI000416F778|nr:HEPN domain-containing protein [Meiothermus rufus]
MERSRDFILQAGRDLEHAQLALERGFYEWAAFAAQQAAEKAVKAVFQRMGLLAWGHSVTGLLQALEEHRAVPEALLDGASELDKAYIPSRYPDALPEGAPFERYRRPEAQRLLSYAKEIYAYCKDFLSTLESRGTNSAS